MAGAGAATADLLYAAGASVGGTALVLLLRPISLYLRIGGGAALVVLAGYGIWKGYARTDAPGPVAPRNLLGTYSQMLGITLVNPLTS